MQNLPQLQKEVEKEKRLPMRSSPGSMRKNAGRQGSRAAAVLCGAAKGPHRERFDPEKTGEGDDCEEESHRKGDCHQDTQAALPGKGEDVGGSDPAAAGRNWWDGHCGHLEHADRLFPRRRPFKPQRAIGNEPGAHCSLGGRERPFVGAPEA